MRRREFITLLGGAAAAWPLAAGAQQPAMPLVGFLNGASAWEYAPQAAAFRQGLSETGFVDGRNMLIDYRWAEGHYERLPTMAADLISRQVMVIAAGAIPAALAAKAATTTIPIVFSIGSDPVEFGLVASLNRPGGNLTGVTSLNTELGPKRLELLHLLVSAATSIAVLVNRTNPLTEPLLRDLQAAAPILGLQLHVLHASTEGDIDSAFTTLVQLQAGGLVIVADAFLSGRSEQLAALALRHAVPTIAHWREFAAAGGLMSYGGVSNADVYRLVGVYTGRILKGEKPADLPVQRTTKVELTINMKTAKALGLTFPLTLLGRADQVIEMMKRREFITLLGGAAAAWPLAAGAQLGRVRWIGVLIVNADDALGRALAGGLEQGLEKLGWSVGRNLAIDYRWGVADLEEARAAVAQVLRLMPDVLVVNGGPAVIAAQQMASTRPIVFAGVNEPVERGFVASLARPGGNTTGFTNIEATLGGKWLELLKEIAPRMARASVMFNPVSSFAALFFQSAEAAGKKLSVEVVATHVHDAAGIDAAVGALGREPAVGLLLPPDGFTSAYRRQIIDLVSRHRVPAFLQSRNWVADGGLISYGADLPDVFRRAAAYVDRILRGEKPADLPVQNPTKFELVINMKTAKALGLTVPLTLQVAADEVIE